MTYDDLETTELRQVMSHPSSMDIGTEGKTAALVALRVGLAIWKSSLKIEPMGIGRYFDDLRWLPLAFLVNGGQWSGDQERFVLLLVLEPNHHGGSTIMFRYQKFQCQQK